MGHVTVDIAGYKVSKSAVDVLITYALGSCVGLALYDPVLKIGGMVHCMLPHSNIDTEKAIKRPGMFVNTGVGQLLNDMFKLGVERKNIIAKLAGASNILDDTNLFNIGKRNYNAITKMLDQNEIKIKAQDVGGSLSRTMYMRINDGKTFIRSKGREVEL